ncbi:hypothetical protein [Streptomyces halobius]|uniref:Uncharacterized protein n=1 Tax=Streptomyces halobius TaxID=2879846 RepID=A0ABY4MID3_9ACTN|nr:hypothetical protein [Streptomyces halobius]UQA97395.1 hypothetical protein K9S39_41005 [Streptomyces halobius]
MTDGRRRRYEVLAASVSHGELRVPAGARRSTLTTDVDLTRIKALADTGVPMARVSALLAAGPEEFTRAVEEIDKVLDWDPEDSRLPELAAETEACHCPLPCWSIPLDERYGPTYVVGT